MKVTSKHRFSIFISFLFLCFAANHSFASTAKELYDKKEFSKALESLLAVENKTASDYYNIGSTYYRLGQLGRALSYFEKANSLAPNQSDIEYNLQITEKALQSTGQLSKTRSFWDGKFVPFSKRLRSFWVHFLVSTLSFFLIFLVLKIKKSTSNFWIALKTPKMLFVLSLLIISTLFDISLTIARRTQLAALISDESIIRSGPGDSFKQLSRLPSGNTVVLTSKSQNGWRQVRFSLGNVGWIMEKDYLSL